MTLLSVVFGLLIVGMVIATIIIVAEWYGALEHSDVRLSFRSFREFHAIAPEKYTCNSYSVWYRANPSRGYTIVMNNPLNHAVYRLWQHRHTRRNEQAASLKVMQNYLDCVHKDIKNYTEKGVKSRSD